MEPPEKQTVAENPVERAGKDRARGPVRRRPGEGGGAREAGREELVAECRAYLAALKRSPATIAATVQPLKPFFAFLDQCGLDVRAVRRADAAAYRGELAGRYAAHTVDGYLRAVKRFYAWLEKTGRVLLNPLDGLPLPRVKDALPRAALTRAEIKRLLDAPDTSLPVGVRDKAMLELLYSTGLRLAELCALTVYDADVIKAFCA
jgi:site-specific recombinase XerD